MQRSEMQSGRGGLSTNPILTNFAETAPSPRPYPRIRLRPKAGFGGQEGGEREK
jgi:hypothetical protein